MWQNSHGFQTMPERSVTLLLLLLLYAYNIHIYRSYILKDYGVLHPKHVRQLICNSYSTSNN